MESLILGVSAFYHDSAAAIVRDGEITAAAQEERFSRRKNDSRFPSAAIAYCLREAAVQPSRLTAIAFYDHPVLTLDRVIKSILSATTTGEEQWIAAARSFIANKLAIGARLQEELGTDSPVYFPQHHLSHAASAFFASPFERAAILTLDGVGEWATTSIAVGEPDGIRALKEIHYPHSIGLLYSAFTYFCGFEVNSGEYKLMGLAPYGEPKYADQIRGELIEVRGDGSFRLNLDYFGFVDGNSLVNQAFEDRFGGPPRAPESRITQREVDLAASVQQIVDEVVSRLARHARDLTGSRDLCMAGGVALNAVANGRLLERGLFDRIWVQPAAGDAGGAIGAALALSVTRFNGAPREHTGDRQRGSYLGPGSPRAM